MGREYYRVMGQSLNILSDFITV